MALRPETIINNLCHGFVTNWSQVQIKSPNCRTICWPEWEYVLRSTYVFISVRT